MPTELRPSGPEIERDGKRIVPMASIHICDVCGYEGAAFGVKNGDRVISYCGWVDGQPVSSPARFDTHSPAAP